MDQSLDISSPENYMLSPEIEYKKTEEGERNKEEMEEEMEEGEEMEEEMEKGEEMEEEMEMEEGEVIVPVNSSIKLPSFDQWKEKEEEKEETEEDGDGIIEDEGVVEEEKGEKTLVDDTIIRQIPTFTFSQLKTLILNSIQENRYDLIKMAMNVIPLDTLSMDEQCRVMFPLLETCYSFDKLKAAHMIISQWYSGIIDEILDQFISQLLLHYSITTNIIRLLIKLFPKIDNPGLLISSFVKIPDAMNVQAVKKILSLYPPLSLGEITGIRDMALERSNPYISSYMTSLLREMTPYSDIPFYIIPVDKILLEEYGHLIPHKAGLEKPVLSEKEWRLIADSVAHKIKETHLKTRDQVIELLRNKIYWDNSEVPKALLNQIEEMPDPVFKEFISGKGQILLNPIMQSNVILTRIYGPAHPVYGQDTDGKSDNDIFGGCRMLLCDIRDITYEEEEFDWFDGSCNVCLDRIRQRHHAVRLPMPSGGWIGCYCSFKCAEEFVDTSSDFEDDDITIIKDLIDEMATSIELGIYDRDYK